MKWILFILLLASAPLTSQTSFSDSEVLAIANGIARLEQLDSLNTVRIKDFESLVAKLEYQARLDSLLLYKKDLQIEILHDREKLYEKQLKIIAPKWYENKYLYYVYGTMTMIISSWMVSNIK